MRISYKKQANLLLFFLLTVSSGLTRGDDTEIYFSGVSNAANAAAVRPNVLLILDSSGSMGWTSGTYPDTRMEVMREAMLQIIDNMENLNVGLMRFTNDDGGPVLFPVTHIDDPASNLVSEPDETELLLTLPITNGNDDAEERAGAMRFSDTNLEVTRTLAISGAAGPISFTVGAGSDDAYECNNNMVLSSFNFHYGFGCGDFRNAYRFTDLPIPQGANITSATVTLNVDNTFSTTNPNSTVSAELIGDSQTFTTTTSDITTRPLTTNSVAWTATEQVAGNPETSPDISNVIEEVVGLADWEPGNALSIIVHSATTGGRRFDSFESTTLTAERPTLTLSYTTAPDASEPATDQTVGLHYPTVDIPRGATITSAKLIVSSRKDQGTIGDSIWRIRAEAVDDSDPLTTTNLSSRTTTANNLEWTVPAMTTDTSYTSCESGTCAGNALTDVIQEVVNRTGWCGGNAMTLLIEPDIADTLNRTIHSFESNSTLAPKLEIEYDKSTGTCFRKTETAQISANYDDTEEQSDGTVQRTSGDLDLSDKLVGLRFIDIDIPQGATILSASLKASTDGISTQNPNPTVNIFGILETDTAQVPSGVIDYLTDLPKTTANVAWSLGDFLADNLTVTTPDLSTVVQEIVNQAGWSSGNSLGFVIGADNRARPIEAHDDNPNQAPILTITYESNTPSNVAITSVRDRMVELINDIPTSGATPIVETLFEAAKYWRGETVTYGDTRDGSRYARISHPASYCDAPGSCNGATTNGSLPITDDYGRFFPTGCTESNLNDWDCRNQTIEGTPTYISPFNSTLTCQSNYQVLLTDGEANANNLTNLGNIDFLPGTGSCTATGANRGTFASGELCGYDILQFLSDNDQNSSLDNDQTVKTYTIGFNTTGLANAANYLKDLAEAGSGQFYEATTASQLVDIFNEIIEDVKSDPTSFVAPSLATNAFNRLLSRDEVYFGLFTPSYNKSWVGNTKKYNICVSSGGQDEDITTTGDNCTLGNILDQNFVNAIDQTTNRFKDTAESVWSDVVDGRATTEGGAGGEITDYTQQIVYTEATSDTSAPASGTSLAFSTNPGFQVDVNTWDDADTAHIRNLVCPTPDTTPGSDCEDRMLWILGKIIDADAETDTSATTRWSVNDVLHSSPAVVTYGGSDSDADGIVDAFFDRIVVGTNDGALRFINGTTGKQEWEFIPQELLGNLKNHVSNTEGDHMYGLDVTPTLRVNDVDEDGFIEPGDGDFVHVIIAMRRGGNLIYALDITPSSTLTSNNTPIVPKFLWRIQGGTADYELLNDTWSQPRLATIDVGGANSTDPQDVLIFGGGYDIAFDSIFSTTYTAGDNLGNAVFIINPDDGTKLFHVGGPCPTCTNSFIEVADMQYSIPSRISILDVDGDGLDDRLYFGDVGGQVWRVDLASDIRNSGSSSGREGSTIVGKLANISTAGVAQNERKFFEPPSVVQVKDVIYSDAANGEYDYVLIGSGNRPSPLGTTTSDRFYAFRDKFIDTMPDTDSDNLADADYPQSGGPISHSISGNLIDITSNILDGTDATTRASLGWYFDFDSSGTDGEKVLAAPTTIAGTVFFTTYLPEAATTDACSANVGGGSAINLDILSTRATIDWNEDGTLQDLADRRKALGGGIPSDVVPIFTKEGVVGIVGIEGGAAQLGTLSGLPRYRTYWYEDPS